MLNLAKRYDVYRHCKFRRAVTEANWIESIGKWKVTLTNLETGKVRRHIING